MINSERVLGKKNIFDKADARAYCLTQLRLNDRDRYLTTLFAPRKAQGSLAALYAFNLECARAVNAGGQEKILGQMRLQWWRESLSKTSHNLAEKDKHLVLNALAEEKYLSDNRLDKLLMLIDAREQDLTGLPFNTTNDVVAHAEATGGALMVLAIQKLDMSMECIAAEIGTAYALVGMLRTIPFQKPGSHYQGRLCLSQEVLSEYNLSSYEIWSRKKPVALAECVAEMAAAANHKLKILDTITSPGKAMSPLLHGSLAKAYLKRLQAAHYDPFAPSLAINPLGRPLLLCWRQLLGRP